jgi:hypothetical protein
VCVCVCVCVCARATYLVGEKSGEEFEPLLQMTGLFVRAHAGLVEVGVLVEVAEAVGFLPAVGVADARLRRKQMFVCVCVCVCVSVRVC